VARRARARRELIADDREHSNVARIRAAAAERGLDVEIRRFRATTRTAVDAAREIGCELAQIIKSIVFLADAAPLLVLVAGSDRVDEAKLRALVGASVVRRATGSEARDITGYPIGGVPPFALARPLPVLLDRGLFRHDTLWAGAGTGETVMRLESRDLVRASGGTVVEIAALPAPQVAEP
jgi:prolyl-tRNA editing enzyme YbaK/EbsC (Cys-tRNA(Pro) deacylase)